MPVFILQGKTVTKRENKNGQKSDFMPANNFVREEIEVHIRLCTFLRVQSKKTWTSKRNPIRILEDSTRSITRMQISRKRGKRMN